MSWAQSKVLAVVPARGGSKGIPRKNLSNVGGLSLIARVGKVIQQIDWIDRAVISTDDEAMAAEGRRFGLDVPFMRPARLANDEASGADVLQHAWIECERHYAMQFDYALYLEPTSPLREASDIERVLQVLSDSDRDTAISVSRAPAHFTPYKCLTVDARGQLGFFLEEGSRIQARQQIPPFYFRNGVVYAVRRDPFLQSPSMITENTAAVIIDRPLVNIDDPLELQFADWFLSKAARA